MSHSHFINRHGRTNAAGPSAPFSASKTGRTLLALLMVSMLMILGVKEGRTDTTLGEEWEEHVERLKAKGEDVKVMRSKSMTPEKSPREFLERYKKVREKAGDKFTFQTFVEDVARGLSIEQRYNKYRGVFYVKKENRNPNYQWVAGKEVMRSQEYLSVNYDNFCITPESLRETFGKEVRIITFQTPETKNSYEYDSMGIYFGVDFIAGMNKNCASDMSFDSDFYRRMEKR